MTLDPRRPVDDLRLLSDRLRAIEDRLDRLAAPSGTQAARSVVRLNNAIATESETSIAYTSSNLTTPVNNFDAADLVFNKPTWATRATVLASGLVFFQGTYNSPGSGTARLRIGGVDGPSLFASSPIIGQVISGGVPTSDETTAGQNVRTLVHARTFDTADATLTVSNRVDVGTFGAGSSLLVSLVATVFWSAP